jgi:hypothetical protein
VAIVQRRLGGLLETKREVVVRLHFVVSLGCLVDLLVKVIWAYKLGWLIGG